MTGKLKEIAKIIRRKVRKKPYLYVNMKKLDMRHDIFAICDDETDVVIEGFPSSANSLSHEIARYHFPSLSISHHTHSIANIKIGLRKNVPIVILIRDPSDAVPSHSFRADRDPYDCLKDYLDFYSFVNKNIERVKVIGFEKVINNPNVILESISNMLHVQPDINSDDDIENLALERIRRWKENHSSHDNVVAPTPEREEAKEHIRRRIVDSDLFEDSKRMYLEIIESIHQ